MNQIVVGMSCYKRELNLLESVDAPIVTMLPYNDTLLVLSKSKRIHVCVGMIADI